MTTDFVVCEARRRVALRELESLLLEHITEEPAEDLPRCVLRSLAATTFSDGAVYLSAEDNGHLHVTPPHEGWDRPLCTGAAFSRFWLECVEGKSVVWSNMSEQDSQTNGLLIPGGGSLMIEPACSFVTCIPHTSVCVWRTRLASQPFSAAPYQVWDAEALKRSINVVFLALEASRGMALKAHTEAVSRAVTSMLNVVCPQLVVLFQLASTLPESHRSQINAQLRVLDEQLMEIQRCLD